MIDYPAILVALTVWAYWARVGAMSWRVRRRTHRLAGVVPEQGLERGMWLLWVPLVATWMTLPLLAATRSTGMWALPEAARTDWLPLAVRWAAAAAAVICLVLTIRCWKRMGKHWKMAVTPGEQTVLITDGPFARVRHPIYGYSILLMMCTLIVVPSPAMLAIAVLHVAMMILKARNEERHLLTQHGDAYAQYVARTGRFFPRLTAFRA